MVKKFLFRDDCGSCCIFGFVTNCAVVVEEIQM
jgi:hypothetical protein